MEKRDTSYWEAGKGLGRRSRLRLACLLQLFLSLPIADTDNQYQSPLPLSPEAVSESFSIQESTNSSSALVYKLESLVVHDLSQPSNMHKRKLRVKEPQFSQDHSEGQSKNQDSRPTLVQNFYLICTSPTPVRSRSGGHSEHKDMTEIFLGLLEVPANQTGKSSAFMYQKHVIGLMPLTNTYQVVSVYQAPCINVPSFELNPVRGVSLNLHLDEATET